MKKIPVLQAILIIMTICVCCAALIPAASADRAIYIDSNGDYVGWFIVSDDPAENSGFIWNESIWGEFRLQPLEMEEVEG